jgi:hypothetical protein
MKRLLIAAFAAVLLAGCGGSSSSRAPSRNVEEDDPGKLPAEEKLVLPPVPRESDLVQFYPGPSVGGHRYYIDAANLLVGEDRIIRYAVVIQTSGGATNITYEGIRCQGFEQRLYATGYPGKGWVESRQSNWTPISRGRVNEYQSFLYAEYFCPYGAVPADKLTIVSALRQGLAAPSPHRGDRWDR